MNELASRLETYVQITNAISKAVDSYPANRFSSSSSLWKELFASRKKSLSFDNLLNLLNTNNDLTKGIANKVSENQIDIYRRYYEGHFTTEQIAEMPMGLTGNPTPFLVHGIPVSLPLLQNYVRTTRISAFLTKMGTKARGLKVLEIGAGFGGMANLLIAEGMVETYTIVDLPENLAQSAFFLTAANPEYTTSFCGPLVEGAVKSLNFIIPQQIEYLAGKSYDLVINCDSLGEMPATVAQSYVELISGLLAPEGVFYSKNGHMRSVGTVPRVSAYGYDKFEILSLHPTPLPSMVFDDHSHELFLGRKSSSRQIDWQAVDLVADLFKFGLSAELIPLCGRLVDGNLTEADLKFFAICRNYFSGQSKVAETCDDRDLDNTANYVLGMKQFSAGKSEASKSLLETYIKSAKSAVAEAQARIALSGVSSGVSLQAPYSNGINTEFLIETVQQPIRTSRLQRALYLQLRKELVSSRFKRVHQSEHSKLIRFKNQVKRIIGG